MSLSEQHVYASLGSLWCGLDIEHAFCEKITIMSSKKRCRQYSIDYLEYGFIESPVNKQLPFCLLCETTLSNDAMKPSGLLSHLTRKHSNKADKNLEYFQQLKGKHENRSTISTLFTQQSRQADKGLLTSYNVSKLIAKCGKPHTIGETLILPAVKEVLNTMIGPGTGDIVKSIPLSNDSVSRRIDEMATDVEDRLCNDLRSTQFALQLDESTLRDNEALLMAYVRYINPEHELVDEFLFAKPLITDTKGSSIFQIVSQFMEEKNIPITNVIACATDGAPSMVGRQRGFMAHLKQASPTVFAIHCVVHRQHLVAKNLNADLHASLQAVIKVVNRIKARSMNDRIFRQLCHNNDEHFERLVLHTEVRWLSKGNCLRRFMELFDTIVEFLRTNDEELCETITDLKTDISYLADVFEKLNEVNVKLQGKDMNLIKAKGIVAAFIDKLSIYRSNISRSQLHQFPTLQSTLQEGESGVLTDTELERYTSHLDAVGTDMTTRFKDLSTLQIPDWVIDPFASNMATVEEQLVEQLTDLKHSVECQAKFRLSGYSQFWIKKEIREVYPQLWESVKLLLIAFPTSYLVEKGFSTVIQLLTKQRNRLDIGARGDLRLCLSNIEPDIAKILRKHQAQGSH